MVRVALSTPPLTIEAAGFWISTPGTSTSGAWTAIGTATVVVSPIRDWPTVIVPPAVAITMTTQHDTSIRRASQGPGWTRAATSKAITPPTTGKMSRPARLMGALLVIDAR
jgi:hypothetical protein